MSYWELSDQQRRSFNGRLFRFTSIDGPLELYSFSSNSNRPRKPDPTRSGKLDPMYFLTKSNLTEAIGVSKSPRDVFKFIRQGVALCEDWGNDLSYMFVLNLPTGLSAHAWVGLAKFQPRGGRHLSALEGGWLQYLIDIDSRLVHYVDGPIRTGR
jgi:hypothetical protein